jgi:phosphogluconate dehydratase
VPHRPVAAPAEIGKFRDHLLRLDATTGVLNVLVDDATWAARHPESRPDEQAEVHAHDLGRELFAGLRRNVSGAEQGAISWL